MIDPSDHIGLAHLAAKKFIGYADYDDMVQEAMIIIIRCASRFDPERGFKFSTYATKSAIRELYARYIKGRRGKRQVETCRLPSILPDREVFHARKVTPSTEAAEMWDIAGRAVTPRQMHVLGLIYRDGLTLDEAGRSMGTSRQNVEIIRNRAIKSIREYVCPVA
jgi:RNA polymerase sigma factor (sigma-70 family)